MRQNAFLASEGHIYSRNLTAIDTYKVLVNLISPVRPGMGFGINSKVL